MPLSKIPIQQQSILRDSWGRWLDGLAPWQWYVTLTFRDPSPTPGCPGWNRPGWAYTNRAWGDWMQYVQDRRPATGGPLQWVRCREHHKDRPSTHFHGLVAGVGAQRRDEAWAVWKGSYGLARILPFNPELGASYYLCKYLTKSGGEIVFSPSLQPPVVV